MAHLFSHTTPRDLGILRAAVFGIWLIVLFFSPFTSYAYLPTELYEPLGIFRLFLQPESTFTKVVLTEPFLFFMKMALLAGCFFCMIGVKGYRWVVIPTVMLLFLADGITKGFNGYVNHAELVVLYSAFLLTIFPVADGFSLFKNKPGKERNVEEYRFALLSIAVVLCLTYTFIAVHRFLYGGFIQFSNHAMEIHLLRNTLEYSKWGFELGLVVVSNIWLLTLFKAGFFALTIFEAFSLFILVNKPFRILWLCVMIPFHILSLLTMNIFFWENLVLIGVLFLVVPYVGGEVKRQK